MTEETFVILHNVICNFLVSAWKTVFLNIIFYFRNEKTILYYPLQL